MTKEDMEMVAMEIVAYAGEARTQFLQAMDAMADKNFDKAEELTVRYKFNTTRSKYKGTGAGESQNASFDSGCFKLDFTGK